MPVRNTRPVTRVFHRQGQRSRPLQHYPRAGTARRLGPTRRLSGAAGAGGASPPAAPRGRSRRPAYRITSPPRTTRHRVRARGPARGRGPRRRRGPDTARLCAAARAQATHGRAGPRSWQTWRRGGPTRPNTRTCRASSRVPGTASGIARKNGTNIARVLPNGLQMMTSAVLRVNRRSRTNLS